jgi:hypothetical protein
MTIKFFIRSKKRKHPKVYLRLIDGKRCNIYCDTGLITEVDVWPNDSETNEKLKSLENYIIKHAHPFCVFDKENVKKLVRNFHLENSTANDIKLFIDDFINGNLNISRHTKRTYVEFKRLYDDFFGKIPLIQKFTSMNDVLLSEFEQYLIQEKLYNSNTARKYLGAFKFFKKKYEGISVDKKTIHQKTYLIKDGDKYKIGKSSNPDERLTALKCGNMHSLEILHIIDRDIERELHDKFINKRIERRREWFSLSEEDIGFIKKIS